MEIIHGIRSLMYALRSLKFLIRSGKVDTEVLTLIFFFVFRIYLFNFS